MCVCVRVVRKGGRHSGHLRNALRGSLRGGGGEDEELADMMDNMVRVSEDAAKNPKLPPLVETAVKVCMCVLSVCGCK